MDTSDIVEELNDLIQLDFDATKTYEEALEHLDAEHVDIRRDLEVFRSDHLRHITELRVVVEAQGGAPREPGRDIKGVLLEGLTKLRSVTGTVGALKAMRMNEKLTNRSYERASELELPPAARDVVLANYADERRHLATIEAHLARLTGDRDEPDDPDAAIAPGEDLHTGARI